MEEDTVELIDYLRVIWKRKILIFVGTLVCIAAGVTVSLRLPKIYYAEALVRIGKTVNAGSVSSSPSFVILDTIKSLAKSIPVECALEEASEYDLNIEAVEGTSLIEIVLKGPDERKTKELLGKVVEKLIADHLSRTENAILFYKVIIGKLETDIGEIQNNLNQGPLSLKKISIDMDKEIDIDMDVDKLDPLVFMAIQAQRTEIQNNHLRRMQIAQGNLKQGRKDIESLRGDILWHQLTINSLTGYKTRLVGEVVANCAKSKKKRSVVLAGIVGLIMSLCLAFFIEYLGKVRGREKVKGDSI